MASAPYRKACQLLLNACKWACSWICSSSPPHQASKRHIAGSWNPPHCIALMTVRTFRPQGICTSHTQSMGTVMTLRDDVDLSAGILGVQDRVWDCVNGFCVVTSRENCLASTAARRVWRSGSSGQGRAANVPTRLLLWHGRCKSPIVNRS